MKLLLRFFLLVSCFKLGSLTVSAQNHMMDSIRLALQEEPKFYVGFHNRNMIINAQKTRLNGLIGGLDFNKKIKIYIGLYELTKEEKILLGNSSFSSIDSVYRSINSRNMSIGLDYTFYSNGKLYLSIPLQVGSGTTRYNFWEKDQTTLIRTEEYATFPIELGSNAYLEVLPFIALKAGLGYRFSVGKKEVMQLTSPYYNLGVALLLGEAFRYFKKSPAEKS